MNVKKKFDDAKIKAKRHAPEIAFATIAIVATTYAIILKNQSNERFPEGGITRLALNGDSMKRLENGERTYWIVDGHTIDLAYDPDC